MSLVREKDLYKAYCDLCFYTGKIPIRRFKWKKGNTTPAKKNRTIEEIRTEIDAVREHV